MRQTFLLFLKNGEIVDKQVGAVQKSVLADKLDKIAQVASNDVLVSNDPSTFVTSLFNFARSKNINNLSQAFNAYSRAGAKYQNNLIVSLLVLIGLF